METEECKIKITNCKVPNALSQNNHLGKAFYLSKNPYRQPHWLSVGKAPGPATVKSVEVCRCLGSCTVLQVGLYLVTHCPLQQAASTISVLWERNNKPLSSSKVTKTKLVVVPFSAFKRCYHNLLHNFFNTIFMQETSIRQCKLQAVKKHRK